MGSGNLSAGKLYNDIPLGLFHQYHKVVGNKVHQGKQSVQSDAITTLLVILLYQSVTQQTERKLVAHGTGQVIRNQTRTYVPAHLD
jgi:uncharacterized protein YbcI